MPDEISFDGVYYTQEEFVNNILSRLTALGRTGLVADSLSKLDPEDPYDRELTLMAEVYSYFQVSVSASSLPSWVLNYCHCLCCSLGWIQGQL